MKVAQIYDSFMNTLGEPEFKFTMPYEDYYGLGMLIQFYILFKCLTRDVLGRKDVPSTSKMKSKMSPLGRILDVIRTFFMRCPFGLFSDAHWVSKRHICC